MKPLLTVTVVLLLLSGFGALSAQESAPAVEPEEPDIVLPEVILRIEDFSVEEVKAGIPGQEELGAPERTVPLPEVGELDIEEPEIPIGFDESRDLVAGERSSGLSAQAVLGAGTLSYLYSQIALNRIGGEEPRFKLRFLHEMLDGVAGSAGAEAGSGFHTREDRLEAGIKFHLGSLGLEFESLFQDQERGLQQIPNINDYISHVHRQGELDMRMELPLGERLTLKAQADGSFASQLLTGTTPGDETELLLAPTAALEFAHKSIWMGLEGDYTYRALPGGTAEELHRGGLQAYFGAEFLTNYRFEARGGWAWNSDLGHLFPVTLSLSGTPFSTFSFQASGGYRVMQQNYADLLAGFPLPELPATPPEDDRGWFADLGMSFTLTQNLSLQVQALLARSEALLWPDGNPPLPASGLFAIPQNPAVQLNTDARLRWNLGALITLSAGLHTEFLDRAPEAPLHSGIVEIQGNNDTARWGGDASLEFAIGDASLSPLLSAGGFYNITDTISLIAEIEDLLHPILGDTVYNTRLPTGGLYAWEDYEAPGLRGTVKVQINL
jgi:hypothetical protein